MRTPLWGRPPARAQPARCFLPFHGAQLAHWSHPPRGSEQGLPPLSPSSRSVEARRCRSVPGGVRCPAPASEQGRYPPDWEGSPEQLGSSPGISRCRTHPSPSQGHLELAGGAGGPGLPEVPGTGRAPASQSFCNPAPWSPAQAASPAPTEPPSTPAPSGAGASHSPGPLSPSLRPGPRLSPVRPRVPLPNPGPVLRPLGFTVAFCCQRRARRNCWHCQKPCVHYDSPNIPLFLLFC